VNATGRRGQVVLVFRCDLISDGKNKNDVQRLFPHPDKCCLRCPVVMSLLEAVVDRCTPGSCETSDGYASRCITCDHTSLISDEVKG